MNDQDLDIDAYQAELERSQLRSRARFLIVTGLLLLIGGLAITLITFQHASSGGGGRYVIAWGPAVVGFIRLIRGFSML